MRRAASESCVEQTQPGYGNRSPVGSAMRTAPFIVSARNPPENRRPPGYGNVRALAGTLVSNGGVTAAVAANGRRAGDARGTSMPAPSRGIGRDLDMQIVCYGS